MEPVHPDLEALAFLLGEWQGEGVGRYPTVAGFTYRETATYVAPPGKAFIAYRQQTWRTGDHPQSGAPLHTETGYLRPAGADRAELVLAQPTGVVEVLHGTVSGGTLSLRATAVATTATAKEIESVERNITVEGDRLRYRLLMGAVGQSHQLHLDAELARTA